VTPEQKLRVAHWHPLAGDPGQLPAVGVVGPSVGPVVLPHEQADGFAKTDAAGAASSTE